MYFRVYGFLEFRVQGLCFMDFWVFNGFLVFLKVVFIVFMVFKVL